MGTLRNFSESLLAIWNDCTPAARIGLVILSLLCVGMIGFVGYWSSQPSYVTLVSDIDSEKMASVVDALDKAGIKYEVGGAGGVLRVDKRSFAKARLIARGQGISQEETSDETGIGNMWMDDKDRQNAESRKKEQSLEQSIRKYVAIDDADVHLNIPPKGAFERKVSDPSASVLLTLLPNERLTDENVMAIAELVAYAVQDLEPEAVRISDKNGNVYQVPDDASADINGQIDYTTQYERKLVHKAESLLTQFLGYGNARVQVSVDMTFKQTRKDSFEIDSEGKVATVEDIESKTTTQQAPDGQPAGVGSNLNGVGNSGASSILDKSENISNSYLVPQTQHLEINNTPVRNYMTVSVLVNQEAPAVLQEDGTLTPDIDSQIQSLVSNAIGFREDTDSISVMFQKFSAPDLEAVVGPGFDWVWMNELLRNVSLALAAVIALVIGLLTLRRFQKPSTSINVQVPAGRESRIHQLNDLARTNPEVFANIMRAWVGNRQKNTPDDSDTPVQNAA